MNIDALSSLAFSIYSNRGAYALLLGAGISKAVGMPTGWDIVIDQLERLAAQNGGNDIPDLEKWFKNRYGKPASYSTVLDECVNTPSERVGLLKPYFEKDSNGNNYEPSLAHKCIAKLVKRGYVKVILTTNFDRLLEVALSAEGVTYQVISDVADIFGSIPLVHNPITIIKINGDYLDCRFRNTESELNSYPEQFRVYLKSIFNDFGLITCGWSAQWDIGIVSILRSVESRRYSSFCTYVDKCNPQLEELAQSRSMKVLDIKSADTFFYELNERLVALERVDGAHPLSKEIAVARAKKYLTLPVDYISLNDLLESETSRAKNIIRSNIDIHTEMFCDNLQENIKLGYSATQSLIAIATEVAHWSKDSTIIEMICDSMKRLSQAPINDSSTYRIDALYSYKLSYFIPYYAICFAAVRYNNYQLLWALANIKIPKYPSDEPQLFLEALHDDRVGGDLLNKLFSTRYKTPQSTYIHNVLNNYCISLCMNPNESDTTFDITEYFLCLLYREIVPIKLRLWVPSGEFVWRETEYRNSEFKEYFAAADQMKEEWPPIKAGMFGGKYEIYIKVKSDVDEFVEKHYYR